MSNCVFVLVKESPTELRDRAEIDSIGVQYRSHENEEGTESDQEFDDSRISVPTSRQSQHKVVLLSPTLYVCGNRYWSARSKFLSNQREPSVFFLYRVSKKKVEDDTKILSKMTPMNIPPSTREPMFVGNWDDITATSNKVSRHTWGEKRGVFRLHVRHKSTSMIWLHHHHTPFKTNILLCDNSNRYGLCQGFERFEAGTSKSIFPTSATSGYGVLPMAQNHNPSSPRTLQPPHFIQGGRWVTW